MLRTSRTFMAALVVFFALGAVVPASAQTASKAKARATRGTSSAKVKRAAPGRVSTTRVRTSTATAMKLKAQAGNRATPARQTVRVNRAATSSTRAKNALRSAFTGTRTVSEIKANARNQPSDAERRMTELFTRPADGSNRRYDDGRTGRRDPYARRGNDSRRGYGSGYYDGGYRRGYRDGYRTAFRYGLCYGRCYRHHHYYGPRLVFGWHYGGFGFYDGRWHFAIVIGGPVIVHRHYYNYSWWDGRYASLYTWDRAMEVHPANYAFVEGACVELWLRTADGTDYEIKVDPSYWNARDPGDLYAALWAELEKEGQLQIVDVNGAVHIFPAGMIQQIEARPCN